MLMGKALSVAKLLDGHVTLDVECFDRLYLNAYVPKLQTPGGVVYFFHDHRGQPIASPALFRPMGDAFRKAVADFAMDNHIPVIRLKAGERKLDVVRPHLEHAERSGVVALGVAQETQRVTMGTDVRRNPDTGCPSYSFRKADRRVTVYYFYIDDSDFGPCFIKICASFPSPAKVWCNGPEWVKRQLEKRGITYEELSNGLLRCEDPKALTRICRSLSPRKVQALFDRWIKVIPQPLTPEDRVAGYDWELSMNQIEFSRTLVLDRPVRGARLLRARHHPEPRPRAARGGRTHLLPPGPLQHPRALLHPGRHPRRRAQDLHWLQVQPRQAIPQGREGHQDRDRDQQPHRHRHQAQDRAPRSPRGHLPPGQPTYPRRPEGRNSAVHDPVFIRAGHTAGRKCRPMNRGLALRGS
jgi:hypothetical protein